jgi:hypothetical protein
MWSSEEGMRAYPPYFKALRAPATVELGTSPTFYGYSFDFTADLARVDVLLRSGTGDMDAVVQFDCVLLVEGTYPVDRPPERVEEDCRGGDWGGREFTNLIRNPSAERGWPFVRPWAEKGFKSIAGSYLSPTTSLAAAMDFEATSSLYPVTAINLFRTFWGRFGWGHISLPSTVYWTLGVATLLAVAGAMIALWKVTQNKPREWIFSVAFLGIAAGVIWFNALLRGFFTVLDPTLYVPTARYAYPAIIPTFMLLAAGWRQISIRRIGIIVALILMVVLDILSIWTIHTYYASI